MTFVSEEIESQPELWRRAAALAAEQAGALPDQGARVALFGCGTSRYVAQAIAAPREAAGHGETDAFPASEMPSGRRYDLVVALSRSGTTTEVPELTRRLRESMPVLAVTAQADGPLAENASRIVALPFADERSVVQTRFATCTVEPFRAHLGERLAPVVVDGERALSARYRSSPTKYGRSSSWAPAPALGWLTRQHSRCARRRRRGAGRTPRWNTATDRSASPTRRPWSGRSRHCRPVSRTRSGAPGQPS